jgi:hypothetical protein
VFIVVLNALLVMLRNGEAARTPEP